MDSGFSVDMEPGRRRKMPYGFGGYQYCDEKTQEDHYARSCGHIYQRQSEVIAAERGRPRKNDAGQKIVKDKYAKRRLQEALRGEHELSQEAEAHCGFGEEYDFVAVAFKEPFGPNYGNVGHGEEIFYE